MWRYAFFLLLATTLAAQTNKGAPLEFATKSLPKATVGRLYDVTVKLQGGKGPFVWTIAKGKLPPGVALEGNTGAISGTATEKGDYTFTLDVRDETTHANVQRQFTIKVQAPLLLEWVTPPKLSGNTISGSVKVSNSSPREATFDLTVFIVAVNEVGKAFALGYQHLNLAYQVEQKIPFESTLPNGRYFVHVDAVAEIKATDMIYRSMLQTPPSLVVNVNR